jgi:hypothetical protein
MLIEPTATIAIAEVIRVAVLKCFLIHMAISPRCGQRAESTCPPEADQVQNSGFNAVEIMLTHK